MRLLYTGSKEFPERIIKRWASQTDEGKQQHAIAIDRLLGLQLLYAEERIRESRKQTG